MKVLSVLVALTATVGILFLVSAPTGGGHGEGHGKCRRDNRGTPFR